MTTLKLGSSGPGVGHWFDWATKYAASYAFLLGKRDLYYGNDEASFTKELQRRLGLPINGIFGDVEAARTGYKWPGTNTPPVIAPRRPIWMYTAPGSGAPGNVGPPFLVGQAVMFGVGGDPNRKSLGINHQWLGYPIGGYLGFMGGDPAYSYEDICEFVFLELGRQLRACPDIGNPNWEGWFVGYSQGAEAILRAVLRHFGDGGEFAHLRSRVNGVIAFGNPTTQGTGIARKVFPEWLNRLTRNINHPNDFYAVANDRIRPLFYEWFVKADTDMPFIVYTAQVIIPALTGLIPGVGALLAAPLSLVLNMIPGAGGPPNPELVRLLSIQGLTSSLPDFMTLIAAIPGLQAHGFYDFIPGYDIVASFRRP